MNRRPVFPPARPLHNEQPWEDPQTLARNEGGPTLRNPMMLTRGGGGLVAPGSLGTNPQVMPNVAWIAAAHQYAHLISLRPLAQLVSARVLDSPTTYRNFLAFRNPNAVAVLRLDFGRDADANSVFELQPNQVLAFDTVVPQDDVYVISTVANATLSLVYSTVALPPTIGFGGV